MKSKNKTLQSIKTFVSHRAVAVVALVAAVAMMMGYVTLNMRIVTINDGTENRSVVSLSTDSGLILKAAGLEVEEDDVVTSEWEFSKGEITVARAFDVTIAVDGVRRVISMTEGTVADALKKAGITLSADDTISVPAETAVTSDMTVTVDRVTYVERTETEALAFGSTQYETNYYEKGETVIETAGVNGEVKKIYRDRLVNGKVVETALVQEVVTKEPVDEVVAVGTYVPPTVSAGSGSTADFTYSAVYYGLATAYTNENGLAGKYTSTGMLAQVGVVAVNPDIIPYGSRLFITTPDGSYVYGYAIAGDTGGFIYSHPDTIVDLFMNTAAECYAFGRRDIVVYVLE